MAELLDRPKNRDPRSTSPAVESPVLSRWIDRPAQWPVVLILIGLTLAAPFWLLADQVTYFILTGDDFAYLAESRTWPTTFANLMTPHNTHIVPLFRLWTSLLITLAGRLANLPTVIGVASYLGLVAAMLAVGRFVYIETQRTAVSLAAMALLGISSILESAVTWYSAGQAVCAGAAVVLTLILTRNWLVKGGQWRFVLMCLSAIAAPAIWSGGHVAGPAAAAYLWVSGGKRARSASLVLIGLAASVVLFELVLVRHEARETPIIWETHKGLLPRPIQAILHSTQAIAETLVFANLGLDTITSPLQSVVLVIGLVGVWGWSKGSWRRISPLEASGATIVVVSCLMVYTFRGNLPYSSLRALGWYHAIPQIGAVLFAAGWLTNLIPTGNPNTFNRLTRKQALILFCLILLQWQMQQPRALRLLLAAAPAMTEEEVIKFPIPELQRLRARYFREEEQARQRRHLTRLDTAEKVAARLGIGPESIRLALGRILMPGIPELQMSTDVVSIMALPPDTVPIPPERVRKELGSLINREPEPRPPWLDSKAPWFPKR